MEKEPTISELLNQIKLMELALDFYANKENYRHKGGFQSMIDADDGSQARFALSQIKKISDYETSLIEEVNRLSKEITDQIGDEKPTMDDIIDQFNKLKQELKQQNK